MRPFWAALAGFPPVVRWGVLGAGGAVLGLLIGLGVWTLLERREAAAERALISVTGTYRAAMAPRRTETELTAAATDLREFLAEYPRSGAAARAWYYVGNLEYQRGDYDAALEAFREAVGRDAGSVVGALSRLGLGYAWEAKGEVTRALETYRDALAGREPGDFLYGELLLATARVQEQLDQSAAAIETYQRFLREMPDSPRGAEVRLRLAILGPA